MARRIIAVFVVRAGELVIAVGKAVRDSIQKPDKPEG
jgi:hypothetical protein